MRRFAAGGAFAILLLGVWGAFPPNAHAESGTDDWGGLPAGPGRENIFYICAACHSLAIVLQQRLTRDSWEETLVWMVEEQGMPEPEPEELTIILDYLGSRFSAVTPR